MEDNITCEEELLIGITVLTTTISSLSTSASTCIEYTDVKFDEANLDNHKKEQSLPIPDENSSLEDGESEDVFTYGQTNDSQEQELTDQTADAWNLARGGGTWVNEGGRWWYRHYDGSYTKNGWEEIGGLWYHFDTSGWMENGYWMAGNGIM